MKNKAFSSNFERNRFMFFSLLLAIAVVAVSFVCMSARAYASDVSIQNITWGTGDSDTVLSWDPVDGAVWYEIHTYDVNDSSIYGSTSTSISSCDCKETVPKTGTYIPRVRAFNEEYVVIAEGWGTEKYFELPQLLAPSNIKIEDGVVTWDAVPNAGSYIATIYTIGYGGYLSHAWHESVETNRIGLKKLAPWVAEGNTYAVGIQAIHAYNSGYGDSENVMYTFVFQGFPEINITNITWGTGDNDRVLSWNPVEGAVKYNVFIDGSSEDTFMPSLDCKRLIRSEGTVVPIITAYNEYKEEITNADGPEKYFTMPKLASPSNIKIEGNVVSWDAVSDASEYCISLYRYETETDTLYSESYFYTDLTLTTLDAFHVWEEGNTYVLMVSAIDQNGDFAESEPGKSEYFVYEKTFAVNTAVVGEGGTISASATVKNHENYLVTLKPKKGYVVDYLKVNGVDVTAEIVNNKYTIADITADKNVEVGFSTCNHNWNAGVVTAEATCKAAGEKTYTCSVCDGTKTEEIPKLTAHTWNDGEVYEEPTCGATGLFRYTCEVCELTKDEILVTTNTHSYGEFVVTTEPTCGNIGIKARTCTECGHKEEEAVPATGNHKFSSATHKCTVCGLQDPSYVPLPEITTQPSNVTVTAGATATFKVAATGEGLKYQWKKSTDGGKTWVNSSSTGATTNTLTMATKVTFNGYKFKCVVTNQNGKIVESNAVTLTVKAGLAITTQPSNVTVAAGATATFKITATGDTLKYQWKKSTNGGTTWVNSASTGATTNTLTMATKATYNGYKFKCVVTDKDGKSVESNAVTLTVTSAGTLAITTQPTNVTVTAGATATFKIAATGTGLKYQWKKSSDGGNTWVNSSSTGATTNTLSMATKASYNGLKFKCVVTDANGKSVTSNAATLTVTAAGALAITSQPSNTTVAAGATATFKVAATGTGLKYQWKKSSDGGNTWVNSSSTGATTNTLSMATKASYNGLKFKCVVTDANNKTVTSNVVTLTVASAGTLAITTQPTNVTVTAGTTATFKVAATGTGLKYQWKKSTDGGNTWVNSSSTGATTNTLSMATKASYNNLKFKCVVTDKTGKTVTSNVVTLTVK